MRTAIIELVSDGCYISKHRGFLRVEKDGRELKRVPLADVAAVIAGANASTWSQPALASLGTNGIPVVICGPKYLPVGVLWPLGSHHETGARIRGQLELGRPAVKRAWQALVKSKIAWQAALLRLLRLPDAPLLSLLPKVRSGDPTNIEAQAARRYWKLLFGKQFRRNREDDDINGLLNYGYTVLRSATARAVTAAGLHPGLAFGHTNRCNAFALVDDLVEPFRPHVDRRVCELRASGMNTVTKDAKRKLVEVLYEPITRATTRPLIAHVHVAAQSVASYCLGKSSYLALPEVGWESGATLGGARDAKTAVRLSDDVDACLL